MKLLRLVPVDTNYDFIAKRLFAFVVSGGLFLGALGIFFTQGLNLGIDFLGGILVEVQTDGPADVAGMRADLGKLGFGDVSLQEFGAPDVVLIRVQRQGGGDLAQQQAVETIKQAMGTRVADYRRIETVGPTVGKELQQTAIMAVVASIFAIMMYIWFRFEWQFGVTALMALVHDVVTTIGVLSVLQIEFNTATVAALLTIAGYSINDTVVVFDRVRENLRRYKKMPLPDLFNLSINSTLSRTTMTSLTTLLSLVALYIFGGEVIRGFTVALIWGILVGTYSSISVALPVLLYLNVSRGTGDEDGIKAENAS